MILFWRWRKAPLETDATRIASWSEQYENPRENQVWFLFPEPDQTRFPKFILSNKFSARHIAHSFNPIVTY